MRKILTSEKETAAVERHNLRTFLSPVVGSGVDWSCTGSSTSWTSDCHIAKTQNFNQYLTRFWVASFSIYVGASPCKHYHEAEMDNCSLCPDRIMTPGLSCIGKGLSDPSLGNLTYPRLGVHVTGGPMGTRRPPWFTPTPAFSHPTGCLPGRASSTHGTPQILRFFPPSATIPALVLGRDS